MCALVLCFAGSAQALVMEAMTLDEMITGAEVVVHGTVVATACRHDDNPRAKRIVTDVTLKVMDGVRGVTPGATTVILTILGGEIGNRGQLVPGMPRFAFGDEVVVLMGAPTATSVGPRHTPVGWSRGVFFVDRTTDPALPNVRQNLDGVTIRSLDGHVGHAAIEAPMSLKALLERVRTSRSTTGGR